MQIMKLLLPNCKEVLILRGNDDQERVLQRSPERSDWERVDPEILKHMPIPASYIGASKVF